jgi:coenzyme F420-reducing hydrogenase delta subunit
MVFNELLDFIGLDTNRVFFSWVSAAEGAKWGALVNEVADNIKKMGPFKDYVKLAELGIGKMEEEIYV